MHALLLAGLAAIAQPGASAELDYAQGTLAYTALVRGDLALAEEQLRSSAADHRNDGAWLLNYGQLLARQGRVNEAREVFRRVALAPDSEVVLASGSVIGTREASRLAARRLTQQSLTAR
ncbi:tetratricopeptide repeat protein [Sphingomonas sp. LHG3406-1]|uniref:tetratricopeptide repeat protein n=1 Tax=Sphingomonas sp. LHG3406-1 TaxID=2804617 RepID=UPI0026193D6E|nr:tetratricopeptide repeat protein [Sphingomonas sp. LHG3406-1]